jgi:hypothetical protein
MNKSLLNYMTTERMLDIRRYADIGADDMNTVLVERLFVLYRLLGTGLELNNEPKWLF